jgi:hypothetical protein
MISSQKKPRLGIGLMVGLLLTGIAVGQTIILRVGGEGGLASFPAALEAVRASRAAKPTQAIDVVIESGTYLLDQPLVLTPQDSGTAEAPVRWIASPGAKPVISGGFLIRGFTLTEDGNWETAIPEIANGTLRFDQLWVNGKRAPRSRFPNSGFILPEQAVETPVGNQCRQTVTLKPPDIEIFKDASPDELANIQVLAYHKWDNTRRFVETLDPANHTFTTVGGGMKPWNRWGKKTGFIFENVRAALDQPGEWHLTKTGKLTYKPRPGETLETAQVIAPRLSQLLLFKGEPDQKIGYHRFDGLSFLYTGWAVPAEGFEPRQAAAALESVIQADHAEHLIFENCEIAHTGLYALHFRAGCTNNVVRSCYVHDTGAGGLRLGTIHNPKNPLETTHHNRFEDNIVRNGGLVFPCAVGVWVGHTSDNQIIHNEISHHSYSGISAGWRWGYTDSGSQRNQIDFNHIHHIGDDFLSDMGAVYTLGPSEGTTISHNHIHHVTSYTYGGWGLYNDEGSTGIVMENNLVHDTKSGGYHQHYGKENIIRNNIFGFSTEHQIEFSRPENHLSFTFTHNIVIWNHGELLGKNGWKKGAIQMDRNLYFQTENQPFTFFGETLQEWQARGRDVNSIIADPKFRDPLKGDWRLPDDSPAFAIGFVPFDPSKAGVRGNAEWIRLAHEEPNFPVRYQTPVSGHGTDTD